MRTIPFPLIALLGLVVCLSPTADLSAQSQPLRPVTVGSQMPDFTLPVFQGGEITFSELRGQNVMVVFPRGLSRPGSWCHICPYQHSELVEYEAQTDWQARANLKILFVLPYGQEMIAEWVDAYPQLLQDIEDGKNPPNQESLDSAGRARMEMQRQIYPKKFTTTKGEVPIPFPILVDGDRFLSEGLGFFTTDWSGSDAEQNVPTILIVDQDGILQFKYMSQNTIDRPPLEYLVQVVDLMNGMGG
ncbi:MAG: redoxin domain-containing protein [Gemmatimonadetes bacterium]|nr:redoxin domain-containing protein [Gemmatimonadota bacterium]